MLKCDLRISFLESRRHNKTRSSSSAKCSSHDTSTSSTSGFALIRVNERGRPCERFHCTERVVLLSSPAMRDLSGYITRLSSDGDMVLVENVEMKNAPCQYCHIAPLHEHPGISPLGRAATTKTEHPGITSERIHLENVERCSIIDFGMYFWCLELIGGPSAVPMNEISRPSCYMPTPAASSSRPHVWF